MIRKLLLRVLLCTIMQPVVAQELNIADLGSLDLMFEPVEAVKLYPGQQLSAQAGFRSGDAFTLVAPGRIQQIEYLLEVGANVVAGQPFAILRGPEMHHFQIEYEATEKILEATRRRFNNNKALYERKAIREDQWIEASQSYYAAQMEYEHLRHFYELVSKDKQGPDTLTLMAPLSGLVDYDPNPAKIETGQSIARFIPLQSVRLETALPNAMRFDIAYLQTDKCRLAIERVGAITEGFFVSVWTEPLKPHCKLIPGQRIMATPLLRTIAYRVPKRSVFQWNGESHIIIRQGQSLLPLATTLLGSEGEDYILRSDAVLKEKFVLSSSVSAVQGLLLGLGQK